MGQRSQVRMIHYWKECHCIQHPKHIIYSSLISSQGFHSLRDGKEIPTLEFPQGGRLVSLIQFVLITRCEISILCEISEKGKMLRHRCKTRTTQKFQRSVDKDPIDPHRVSPQHLFQLCVYFSTFNKSLPNSNWVKTKPEHVLKSHWNNCIPLFCSALCARTHTGVNRLWLLELQLWTKMEFCVKACDTSVRNNTLYLETKSWLCLQMVKGSYNLIISQRM